jgi:hypothetical protein
MSADGFVTQDVFFAAAMLYIHTADALIKIETVPDTRGRDDVNVTLDIASLDGATYHEEFLAGTLAISDLKAYCRVYSLLTGHLKNMRREGTTVYVTPAWINGRG